MARSRCLITGSHGFIGQALSQELINRGYEVVPLNRLLNRYWIKIPEFDHLIHLAAYGNHSHQTDEEEIYHVNIARLWELLQMTKDFPYQSFINVSSSSVLLPHETIYSATKAAGERLCKAISTKYDKPIVTLRPYSIYGPGEAENRFIPTVFRSCLTGEPMKLDPSPVHDWTYIDDFIDSIIDVMENAKQYQGQTLEVGTGISTTNREVVARIELLTGKKANIVAEEKFREYDNIEWVCHKPISYSTELWAGLGRIYEHKK